jgi:hypothetical protein
VNELAAHFDPRGLCYVVNGYDGARAFTREPVFNDWPYSDSLIRGLSPGHAFYVLAELETQPYAVLRTVYARFRGRWPRAEAAVRRLRSLIGGR